MKFKSPLIAADRGTRERRLLQLRDPVARFPLDSVFHGLLIAAGVALSIGAAAEAALDSHAAATDGAQTAMSPRAKAPQIARRGQPTSAQSDHGLKRSPRTRS